MDKYDINYLPVDRVLADSTFNCRGPISALEVIDLAADIKTRGLDQPIVVRPYSDPKGEYDYQVVAGHRRHKAFRYNGTELIPAYVRTDMSEIDARMLNLRENLHRKDLNIKQEATGLKYFFDCKNPTTNRQLFTDSEIAKIVGQSLGWVAPRKMLLSLPAEIQDEAAAGMINAEHIKLLSKLRSRDDQFELVRKIKEKKLRGEKVKLSHTIQRATDVLKAKERDRTEVLEMNGLIYDIIGPSIITRYGAWVAGEISTASLFTDIENYCKDNDIPFNMPEFVKNAVSGKIEKQTVPTVS